MWTKHDLRCVRTLYKGDVKNLISFISWTLTKQHQMDNRFNIKVPSTVKSSIGQHAQPVPPMPPVRESKMLPLGNRKFITIRKYNGQPMVNLRLYIRDSYGKPYATKRGILLSQDEFHQLRKHAKDIARKLNTCKQPSTERSLLSSSCTTSPAVDSCAAPDHASRKRPSKSRKTDTEEAKVKKRDR